MSTQPINKSTQTLAQQTISMDAEDLLLFALGTITLLGSFAATVTLSSLGHNALAIVTAGISVAASCGLVNKYRIFSLTQKHQTQTTEPKLSTSKKIQNPLQY